MYLFLIILCSILFISQTIVLILYIKQHKGVKKSMATLTTTSAFAALQSRNLLTAGQQYQINDYKPTWFGENYAMAGNQFDVIITATGTNTYDENVTFAKHTGDTYFANCDLSKWTGKIKDIYTTPYTEIFIKKTVDGHIYGAFMYINGEVNVAGQIYYRYLTKGGEDDSTAIPHFIYSMEKISSSRTPSTLTLYYVTNEEEPTSSNLVVLSYDQISAQSVARGLVLARLTDEYGNSCPWDFKNVIINTPFIGNVSSGSSLYIGYTFSRTKDYFDYIDDTVNPYSTAPHDNYIADNSTLGEWELPILGFGHNTKYNVIAGDSRFLYYGDDVHDVMLYDQRYLTVKSESAEYKNLLINGSFYTINAISDMKVMTLLSTYPIYEHIFKGTVNNKGVYTFAQSAEMFLDSHGLKR